MREEIIRRVVIFLKKRLAFKSRMAIMGETLFQRGGWS